MFIAGLLFSCTYILATTSQIILASSKIPPIFLPLRVVPQSAQESLCKERVQAFADAMGTTEEALVKGPWYMDLVAWRFTFYKNFLTREQVRFEALLTRLALVSQRGSFPGIPDSLQIYGNMFWRLFGIHPSFIRPLLDASTAADQLALTYKAVMIARHPKLNFVFQGTDVFWLSDIFEYVCRLLMMTSDVQRNTLAAWVGICGTSDGLQALRLAFETLHQSEFHLLLGWGRDEHYDRLVRIIFFSNRLGIVHNISVNSANTNFSSILNKASLVPIEVDPLGKLLCRRFGLLVRFTCLAITERYDFLVATIPLLTSRIIDLRRNRSILMSLVAQMPEEYQLLSTDDVWLGYELDFDVREFPLNAELTATDKRMLKMLQIGLMNREATDVWPGIERVLKAGSLESQAVELAALTSRKIIFFIRGVVGMCRGMSEVGRCRNLRQAFMELPQEFLLEIMSGNDDARISGMREFLGGRMWEIFQFIGTYRRSHEAVEENECCVCKEAYGEEVKPVEMCPPAGHSVGHFVCDFCVSELDRRYGRLDCPVCRRAVI